MAAPPSSSATSDPKTEAVEPKKDSAPAAKPSEVDASRAKSPTPEPQPTEAGTSATTADVEAEAAADDEEDEDAPSVIDMETFMQILDLDEDDTHEFSKGMAWAYFSQADTTFTEMDDAVTAQDLPKLSSLGHFLKGSSAALGVSKVQASCEQIQHYGQSRDEELNKDLTKPEALEKIGKTLRRVKGEYGVAEKWLRKWYREHGGDEDPES